MIGHPLHGCRLKTERAKEHFRGLVREVEAFAQLQPYGTFTDEDPKTGERVLRARVSHDCPERWATISGDVVHNLRATLDYLIWQMVLANNKTPGKNTAFPMCTTPECYNTARGGQIKGVSQATDALIDRFQPYHADDPEGHPLYVLHRLDIRDKHQLLNVLAAALSIEQLSVSPGTPGQAVYIEEMRVNPKSVSPVKDGTELIRVRSDPPMDMKGQFTFEITLEEGGPGKGGAILPTLNMLINYVDTIVTVFAASFV